MGPIWPHLSFPTLESNSDLEKSKLPFDGAYRFMVIHKSLMFFRLSSRTCIGSFCRKTDASDRSCIGKNAKIEMNKYGNKYQKRHTDRNLCLDVYHLHGLGFRRTIPIIIFLSLTLETLNQPTLSIEVLNNHYH